MVFDVSCIRIGFPSRTRTTRHVSRTRPAPNALRDTPGIMKLIEARIFKFDDFLTDGQLDVRKLAKDRVLQGKQQGHGTGTWVKAIQLSLQWETTRIT